jgi:hypothetical protein
MQGYLAMAEENEPIDIINSPPHYNTTGMETIDLIKNSMTEAEFEGYLKGNVLKYVSRYRVKHKEDPLKDLLKAQWYLNKLLLTVVNSMEEKQ